jgi:hypothetical protein
MIYVTGDLHGELSRFDAPAFRRLKAEDTLIVCGDFGFLWDGGEEETRALEKLGRHKYQTLFIDGKHENFDLLEAYPAEEWNGGKARHIAGNLYHLMRGQVYEIEGKKIFTFGGGESPDKEMRVEMGKWWEREMPTLAEMRAAVDRLNEVACKVDYVITHEPPARVRRMLEGEGVVINALDAFLDELSNEVQYRKWFFGCLHIDRKISAKYYALFNDVVPVEELPRKRWLRR